MIVVNKKSEELKEFSSYIAEKVFVRIEDTRFAFSIGAQGVCNLKEGEYVHFLNDGSEWRFYTNDDADGFKLLREGKFSKKGAIISDIALVRMFRKSTGFSHSANFEIKKTNIIYDRCDVWEINTKKPITKKELPFTNNQLKKVV